jgi:4-amino-4-deoxy-L-arabinose transferase-like glycosyltransferase
VRFVAIAREHPIVDAIDRTAALPLVLLFAVLAPFHHKAFTIDDTLFMLQAQHALADPLHPTAFEVVWYDVPARLSGIMPSGPVMAWLLLPAALAGGAEWIAHALVAATFAAAVLGTVSLARRFGLEDRCAVAAGILLVVTPAAVAMAGTAMPDVPAMALGVCGLERLLAWKQHRRLHQGVCAAILLGLAPLARSHLLLLLAPASIFLFDRMPERWSWRTLLHPLWAPVLAAPIVSLVVMAVTRDPGGHGGLASSSRTFSSFVSVAPNLVAFGTHCVLASPLAVAWALIHPGVLRRRLRVYVVTAIATAVVLVLVRERHLWLAAVAALGIAVVWDVLALTLRSGDPVRVALGVWLLVPAAVIPYLHLPSKYLLASAPAVAILIAREAFHQTMPRPRAVLGITCVLGLALGVAILRADAALADVGRRAAAELIAPNVAAGRTVWFTGHWGSQWYAMKAGGRCMTTSPPWPGKGDLVVRPQITYSDERTLAMLDGISTSVVGRVEDREPGGRVMSAAARAGFFSNGCGYLPWAWSAGVLDAFQLLQVE